jgi:SAM-dependent methyltransferase
VTALLPTGTAAAPTVIVAVDGRRIRLDVARWRREVTADEWSLLAGLADPVLDIGCGPGRVAVAFATQGRPCLGIDPSPRATSEARGRGAHVITRSVFDALPGEGRWGSAVLLDGNVGIGGQPVALLARVHSLLRCGGSVLVELEPPGHGTEHVAARIETGGAAPGPWFPWARVAADDFAAIARATGFTPRDPTRRGGRWFAIAVRR